MGPPALEILVPAGAHKRYVSQRTTRTVRLWRRADKRAVKGISLADPCSKLVAVQQRLTQVAEQALWPKHDMP